MNKEEKQFTLWMAEMEEITRKYDEIIPWYKRIMADVNIAGVMAMAWKIFTLEQRIKKLEKSK